MISVRSMQRRALVTGAGGFIGSHLVEALVRRGDSVRALVRYNARGDRGALEQLPSEVLSQVEVVAGDLTDPFFTRELVRGCDVAFHLASLIAIPYSYQCASQVFSNNLLSTLHVAQACLDAGGARMVHTSTSEVYGTAQFVPITEAHPLVGQSPYAASKIAADQCVESFVRSFGLRAVTVRPFNTYGPRQSTRAVLPTILTQVLAGQALQLGKLTPTRDLVNVADTVRGFMLAAERDEALGRTVQLATGREISVGDLAALCMRVLGTTVAIVSAEERLRPAASEVERLLGDPSRAAELLGWRAEVSLEDGVARFAAWMRDNLGRYRPGEYQR
ncbi:MAG: SDR family NAD(P)-dependent oxidoreductase [Deltaproteobacteria bacterium]|nr:SDR family NAD(P)-dependent oxidoreductase [Deltaproteobacteria bacterium]